MRLEHALVCSVCGMCKQSIRCSFTAAHVQVLSKHIAVDQLEPPRAVVLTGSYVLHDTADNTGRNVACMQSSDQECTICGHSE